jgi:prepilin-type N-terminal cleavage/methylation domain-containing protein
MCVSPAKRSPKGFTLLEICSAIAVILILATLSIPAIELVQSHIERVNCSSNLRQLYVSASAYYQDHRQWPQVNPALLQAPNNAYYEAWIEAYLPYGASRQIWICPTIQRNLGNPDYTQQANYRTDYIVTPYDSKPLTPVTWPSQPWFAERGNVHGTGNLIVLANGSVTDLDTVAAVGGY